MSEAANASLLFNYIVNYLLYTVFPLSLFRYGINARLWWSNLKQTVDQIAFYSSYFWLSSMHLLWPLEIGYCDDFVMYDIVNYRLSPGPNATPKHIRLCSRLNTVHLWSDHPNPMLIPRLTWVLISPSSPSVSETWLRPDVRIKM